MLTYVLPASPPAPPPRCATSGLYLPLDWTNRGSICTQFSSHLFCCENHGATDTHPSSSTYPGPGPAAPPGGGLPGSLQQVLGPHQGLTISSWIRTLRSFTFSSVRLTRSYTGPPQQSAAPPPPYPSITHSDSEEVSANNPNSECTSEATNADLCRIQT